MTGRISRLCKRTEILRNPVLIPMSDADRRDMELLNQRNEERRREREQREQTS